MKLLVYADGGCHCNGMPNAAHSMYGSYAAYEVPAGSAWAGEASGQAHARLREESAPVHARLKVPYAPEQDGSGKGRATNNIAEARALLESLVFLNGALPKHPSITEVEICMDSKLTLMQAQGVYATRVPQLRRIHRDISWQLDRLRKLVGTLELSWIPGTVMKKTIIGH